MKGFLSGLSDPYLKTARAKAHLDALRQELWDFAQTKPHQIKRKRDVKNQRYIIRFDIKPVPDFIPLIVGDFLYCLRASLDHLVWQLAKSAKPQSYPRGTEFPILEAPNGDKFRSKTRRVPTEARRIIESLQLYYGRQHDPAAIRSHFLWRLNLLCNIDKHRRIPVHSDVSHMFSPDLPQEARHLVKIEDANWELNATPRGLRIFMTLSLIA